MAEILYSASVEALDFATSATLPATPGCAPSPCSVPSTQTLTTLTYAAEDNALRAHAPIVSIIERLSAAMAVVSWRDSTHCRYGDQVRTIGTARDNGVCPARRSAGATGYSVCSAHVRPRSMPRQ